MKKLMVGRQGFSLWDFLNFQGRNARLCVGIHDCHSTAGIKNRVWSLEGNIDH